MTEPFPEPSVVAVSHAVGPAVRAPCRDFSGPGIAHVCPGPLCHGSYHGELDLGRIQCVFTVTSRCNLLLNASRTTPPVGIVVRGDREKMGKYLEQRIGLELAGHDRLRFGTVYTAPRHRNPKSVRHCTSSHKLDYSTFSHYITTFLLRLVLTFAPPHPPLPLEQNRKSIRM